jgi:hypothetical protein
MMTARRSRIGWKLLVVLALLPAWACRKGDGARQLESRNATVAASYELHPRATLGVFLKTQPPGADAIVVDLMLPAAFVVAKVSLISPNADVSRPPRFVSTFRSSDGTSTTKSWQAASAKGPGEYRGIFGLAKDVVQADTVLAP